MRRTRASLLDPRGGRAGRGLDCGRRAARGDRLRVPARQRPRAARPRGEAHARQLRVREPRRRARGRGLAARRPQPEGPDRPAAGLPATKVLVSVGGWTWSKGFSDAALTVKSRRVFDGFRRRLREAPRPRRARRRLGVPGTAGRRQPAPPRGQGELHGADGEPAGGPRPRGRATREAPAPDVRGWCGPGLRRPHRDGEGAGGRRLREPDDVRLPRRQPGRAGRPPREPHPSPADPRQQSAAGAVKSSSRPASPPRSSSSVCRSTGAPGKASSLGTACTVRAGRPRSGWTPRTPRSPRSPEGTVGRAGGTPRRRRRTCGTRRSRRS